MRMLLARQPGREPQPGLAGIGRIEADKNILERHRSTPAGRGHQTPTRRFDGCSPVQPAAPEGWYGAPVTLPREIDYHPPRISGAVRSRR